MAALVSLGSPSEAADVVPFQVLIEIAIPPVHSTIVGSG